MSRTYSPGYLTGRFVLFAVGLTAFLTARESQSKESKSPRFVPASTYAAMSLNMRAIFKKVDLDDPLMKLRHVRHVDAGFLEDPKLARTVVMFPYGSPSGVLMQFEGPISPNAYFDKRPLSRVHESVQEDYKGRQIHVRRLKTGVRNLREPTDVWFFPERNVVASGRRPVVQQMIDGESGGGCGRHPRQ